MSREFGFKSCYILENKMGLNKVQQVGCWTFKRKWNKFSHLVIKISSLVRTRKKRILFFRHSQRTTILEKMLKMI